MDDAESITCILRARDLKERLRVRARIRRNIPRPEPDRIADICEEAADKIELLENRVAALEDMVIRLQSGGPFYD